jgi:hypothetical protein
MSTGWHPPIEDREAIYRDWYEWAWQATEQNRPLAIAVANAALAASDEGAGLARIIAAANSALSSTETLETPLGPQASTAIPAPSDDNSWSIRDFGLVITAVVLTLIAVIEIAGIAGTPGHQYSGGVSAAKTTAHTPAPP